MSKIVVSSKFKRAFRKFARRNERLQVKIESTIIKISEDVSDPSLGTHKLEGKLANLLSGRVEGSYYAPPLSVRSARAPFGAYSSRIS